MCLQQVLHFHLPVCLNSGGYISFQVYDNITGLSLYNLSSVTYPAVIHIGPKYPNQKSF